jgi:MFS family permease
LACGVEISLLIPHCKLNQTNRAVGVNDPRYSFKNVSWFAGRQEMDIVWEDDSRLSNTIPCNFAGLVLISLGEGGNFYGEVPNVRTLRIILKGPSFWIMMVLLGLGIGASFGVYSMIPLYLVSEKGMDRSWANTLLGMSRISTSFMVLLGGWVMDRWGLKKTLQAVFMSTGLITILLGMAYGSWL